MGRFSRQYAPAVGAMKSERDALEASIKASWQGHSRSYPDLVTDVGVWLALTGELEGTPHALEFYKEVKREEGARRVRDALWAQLFDRLYNERQFDVIMAHTSENSALLSEYAERVQMEKPLPADERYSTVEFVRLCGYYLEALLVHGRHDPAADIDWMLSILSNETMFRTLIRHARRAGREDIVADLKVRAKGSTHGPEPN
jgi:hypothetical protein